MDEDDDFPMNISSDQEGPDRGQNAMHDGLLGSVRSNDAKPKSHLGSLSQDGASDDHLQPPSEDAHARGSLLPSVEPTPSTSKSHRTQRTSTPSENHTDNGLKSSTSVDSSKAMTENPQPRSSLLPSTKPVQSESKIQPTQQAPTQSDNHAGLEPGTSNIPQLPQMTTKRATRREQIGLARDDLGPQQSAQPAKRKREEDPQEVETKSIKKQQSQPKKDGASTATLQPRDATQDESSKRGRAREEEGSTASAKQQGVVEDEAPRKRGRPKKEEGSKHSVKSQRVSNGDTSVKRGRPKKEFAPQTIRTEDLTEQDGAATEIPKKRGRLAREAEPTHAPADVPTVDAPKKRGRPAKKAEPTQAPANVPATDTPKKRGRPAKIAEPTPAVEPAGVPTADTPKKRGRPKKAEGAAQGTKAQGAPAAGTPKKRGRGRARNSEGIAKAAEPQGSSNKETTKKRGRPKGTGQGRAPKAPTPGKRGRPKKKGAA